MTENNKILTVLTVLVAVLIVAVIVQSVAIVGFHKKLQTPSRELQTDSMSITGHNEEDESNTLGVLPPETLDEDILDWGGSGWDPFKEMQSMHDRINQMFGSAFNRFHDSDDFGSLLGDYSFSPDINIEDKGDHYMVTVDLPGVEDSSMEVKVEGKTLTISGTMQSERKEENAGTIVRQERRSGRFHRMVTLPGPVSDDEMKVEHKKGVLYIEIPKEEPEK